MDAEQVDVFTGGTIAHKPTVESQEKQEITFHTGPTV